MMHHLLVVSLLCLTAAFAADAIDHRQSWDGLRNQGTIGSCQTHVAIALLEAEHALQFAEKVDLSEAHLFLHHFLGVTPAETDANLRGMLLGAVAFDRFRSESLQSGHIFEPFRVLQTLGVLLEEDFPYRRAIQVVDRINSVLYDLEHLSRRRDLNEQDSAAGMETFRRRLDEDLEDIRWPRTSFKPQWTRLQRLRSMRATEVNQFTIGQKILEELPCRPVGIEVRTDNLWPQVPRGLHAVVVAGYDPQKREFILRNSWGRGYEHQDEDMVIASLTGISWIDNPQRNCRR